MSTTELLPVGSLDAFSNPASVAIVGASEDPAKWGYWLASGALTGSHRRRVYLVNRKGNTVLGQPCFAQLSDLPEVPDLVVLSVPAAYVDSIVDEALELGVRGFLGITAGFRGEAELAARIRRAGARMVGTNSLGIFDASAELHLAWGRFVPGSLAVISQSGQLGSELAALGHRRGVGISRFVSIGNQSDVKAAELLAELAEHESTRVVALYLESFVDGEELFETLRALRSIGKPTLLLTVGASAASTRLARSHTGSLTSPMDVVDAACRASGALRVNSPTELINIASTFLTAPGPSGNRIAIVGDSGGQCGVAADLAIAARCDVPGFRESLSHRLTALLPSGAACTNPVDLAGAGEDDLANYATVIELLLASDEVDSVVLTGYFGCYGTDTPSLAAKEIDVARRLGKCVENTGKPLVVHTMASGSETSKALWDNGIPVFDSIESALGSLSGLAQLQRMGRARPALVNPRHGEPLRSGYWAARELLTDFGVSFPAGGVVHRVEELADGTDGLSAPFVLKAGWLEHKSEVGGVIVGIESHAQLLDHFKEMYGRLGAGEYVVEEQDTRRDMVEILIGARRDPDLGPVIVVGAGGTEAEMLKDTAVEIAPVSASTAAQMLERLRCMALLRGWRGRPAVAIDDLTELISAISHLISIRPDIGEIELNPVRVAPDRALAVDALVIPGGYDNSLLP